MNVADVSCQTIGALMTRWYDHSLTEVESDAYEQHMLLCPPCLVQAGKLRTALTALPAAADSSAPEELVARLIATVHSHHSGRGEAT
jgi:hypothetical protein